MQIDLEKRHASLAVGEFADFLGGPRDSRGGAQGLWRAQLGSHWHREFRKHLSATHPTARFEVTLSGQILHRGWLLTLSGRIDQLLEPTGGAPGELRELKTVLRTLPAETTDLHEEYPGYFVQVACYRRLLASDSQVRIVADPPLPPQAAWADATTTLVFIEADTGLSQSLRLGAEDERFLDVQLDRVVEFLEQRRRARERLRRLRLRPPFPSLREGQDQALHGLATALASQARPLLLFEAPTGFGKTGILLDATLARLKAGQFERLIYLTSKATGQLQVMRTLREINAPAPAGASAPRQLSPQIELSFGGDEDNGEPQVPLAVWLTRPKAEHCIAPVFRCVRESCAYINDLERKWRDSGLGRHFVDPSVPRDLATLRQAGLNAGVCPYEITRAALPFCDLWIGDFNYVFAPASQGLFLNQPGFEASRTLLVIDEAHNLPARAADAFSRRFTLEEAMACQESLWQIRAPQPITQLWDHWVHYLQHLRQTHALALDAEDDARDLLSQLARKLGGMALDYARMDPGAIDTLWRAASLHEELATQSSLPRLWWAPRDGLLQVTCLDASQAIGDTLRNFGGAVLTSATFGPVDAFRQALGVDAERHAVAEALKLSKLGPALAEPKASHETIQDASPAEPPADSPAPVAQALAKGKLGALTKRQSKTLFKQLTTGAEMLRADSRNEEEACRFLRAEAPWRENAYDMAVDVRVDTSFQHRERHLPTTAATLIDWVGKPGGKGPVAVFIPSYAYAESIMAEVGSLAPHLVLTLQERNLDLAAQARWVEQALAGAQALFLVLGSSFAESIDLLGGRVNRAMVVGPALPEVNPVQQARLHEAQRGGREAAFRQVYQIPGMQKVNQALGRLVRSPGQTARVLLHCRRFSEDGYSRLLAGEYRNFTTLNDDASVGDWLSQHPDNQAPLPSS